MQAAIASRCSGRPNKACRVCLNTALWFSTALRIFLTNDCWETVRPRRVSDVWALRRRSDRVTYLVSGNEPVQTWDGCESQPQHGIELRSCGRVHWWDVVSKKDGGSESDTESRVDRRARLAWDHLPAIGEQKGVGLGRTRPSQGVSPR